MVATILGLELDVEDVGETAQSLRDDPTGEETGRMVSRRYAALSLIHAGDGTAAGELYESLRPSEGWFTLQGGFSGDRLLGLISWKSGNLANADRHYAAALEFCRKGGYRIEHAWSLAEYAEMLIERDESGDRGKAVERQDEAISIAQELGLKPLLERVLAQREILKA